MFYVVIASRFLARQSHVGCTVASGDCFAYMDVGKGHELGAEASFLGNCSCVTLITYIHVGIAMTVMYKGCNDGYV